MFAGKGGNGRGASDSKGIYGMSHVIDLTESISVGIFPYALWDVSSLVWEIIRGHRVARYVSLASILFFLYQ